MERSCIIICGGLSTRMGEDKGLMLFKNKPMIVHLLEKLKNEVDEVLLVLRNKKQCQLYHKILKTTINYEFDLRILSDEIESQGPLSGIYTGLKYINTDHALVLPCDSPLISPVFVNKIFNQFLSNHGEYDAVVPYQREKSAENLEPLHAIYTKKTRKIIYAQLSAGRKDVKSFIKRLHTLYVKVDKLDPSLLTFKNFNQVTDF